MGRWVVVCLGALSMRQATGTHSVFLNSWTIVSPPAFSAPFPCPVTVSSLVCYLLNCGSVRRGSVTKVRSLENCVPKAFVWQIAASPTERLMVWKYLSVHTTEGWLGNCSALSFSLHFAISFFYKCIEDTSPSWILNTRFLFSFFSLHDINMKISVEDSTSQIFPKHFNCFLPPFQRSWLISQ